MSEAISKLAQFVKSLFTVHILKVFTCIASTIFFAILLFPFQDLSDKISSEIASRTGVFLTFDDLGLSLFPPSIGMENVSVDMRTLPTLKAGAVNLAPAIGLSLGVTSKIRNLFSGDVDLSIKQTKTKQEKLPGYQVNVEAEGVELSKLKKVISIPLSMKGLINLDLDLLLEPKFKEQPDGELSLSSQSLTLLASTLPTPFGELPFPEMSFSGVQIIGRLVGSELVINEAILGSPQDNFSARLKGKMDVTLVPGRRPRLGKYEMRTELIVKSGSSKTLGLFLNFIDRFKKKEGNSDVYKLKLTGSRFGAPPQMSALSKL